MSIVDTVCTLLSRISILITWKEGIRNNQENRAVEVCGRRLETRKPRRHHHSERVALWRRWKKRKRKLEVKNKYRKDDMYNRTPHTHGIYIYKATLTCLHTFLQFSFCWRRRRRTARSDQELNTLCVYYFYSFSRAITSQPAKSAQPSAGCTIVYIYGV
jgi:hypothetical protein